MGKSRFIAVGVATALLCGCQSSPVHERPIEGEEVRSELREQEEKQIYDEYMMQQTMMRQRQEVARDAARERQRQRESSNRR
ncbi:MAG: hypothetical protein P8Y01_06420 [Woeseiaceae bacterium]|jgi:hypothetical protein